MKIDETSSEEPSRAARIKVIAMYATFMLSPLIAVLLFFIPLPLASVVIIGALHDGSRSKDRFTRNHANQSFNLWVTSVLLMIALGLVGQFLIKQHDNYFLMGPRDMWVAAWAPAIICTLVIVPHSLWGLHKAVDGRPVVFKSIPQLKKPRD